MGVRIMVGDVLAKLAELPDESVHMAVTSPPYWGLRDYGIEPQVWGGEPGCAHEWGADIRSPWANAVPGPAAQEGGSNPGKNGDGRRNETKTSGTFCRCGAWRGSLGLEPDYRLYIEHMVEVFREVRRVLRKDGTCWLNLGDCYASGGGTYRHNNGNKDSRARHDDRSPARVARGNDLKPKDLAMIPARVAIALQDDGWWLRSDIIWHKLNPMPESTTDRPTTAHEHVFLLAKAERYFYDAEAIKEPQSKNTHERFGKDGCRSTNTPKAITPGLGVKNNTSMDVALKDMILPNGRNKRSVWSIATSPYAEAHFATFPPALVEPCILAGTSERGCCAKCGAPWERGVEKQFVPQGDVSAARGIRAAEGQKPMDATSSWGGVPRGTTKAETTGWQPTCRCGVAETVPCTVLDPFFGAGTTGLVADRLGRDCIGIELNPAYARMAEDRLRGDAGLFADIAAE